ncbi:MAG: hypothetical protein ACRC4M_01190 [Mycoplasma sp.]
MYILKYESKKVNNFLKTYLHKQCKCWTYAKASLEFYISVKLNDEDIKTISDEVEKLKNWIEIYKII